MELRQIGPIRVNISISLADHIEAHLREAVYENLRRMLTSMQQKQKQKEISVRRLTSNEWKRINGNGNEGGVIRLDDENEQSPYCIVYFPETPSQQEQEIKSNKLLTSPPSTGEGGPFFSKLVARKQKNHDNYNYDTKLFAPHMIPVYDLSLLTTKRQLGALSDKRNNDIAPLDYERKHESRLPPNKFDQEAAREVIGLLDTLSASSSSPSSSSLHKEDKEENLNVWLLRGSLATDVCVGLWRWRMWIGEGWAQKPVHLKE